MVMTYVECFPILGETGSILCLNSVFYCEWQEWTNARRECKGQFISNRKGAKQNKYLSRMVSPLMDHLDIWRIGLPSRIPKEEKMDRVSRMDMVMEVWMEMEDRRGGASKRWARIVGIISDSPIEFRLNQSLLTMSLLWTWAGLKRCIGWEITKISPL